MSRGTAARYGRVLEAFGRYAAARGVAAAGDVTPELCERFCGAPSLDGRGPAASTSGVRLAALRSAFDALIEAGLFTVNPASGIRVDRAASASRPCPLTPVEVDRLRAGGKLNPRDTLRPACVALALAGATHSEVAAAVAADFDRPTGGLRLGRSTHAERVVIVDGAAIAALTARVEAIQRMSRRGDTKWDSIPLAMHRPVGEYRRDSVAPAVSMNLSRALDRAGITRAGVRPRSCREYAANVIYARSGRVEDVAQTLGVVSLDAAFRLVDPHWQQRWSSIFTRRRDG